MEKFRTIIGEKKEEPKRELAEVVQAVRQTAEQTPAQPEPTVAPREVTDWASLCGLWRLQSRSCLRRRGHLCGS